VIAYDKDPFRWRLYYLPESSDVIVFTSETQIKQPYEVVGIISYDNPRKFRAMSLGDAIEPLKEKAREVGANAIIIELNSRNSITPPRHHLNALSAELHTPPTTRSGLDCVVSVQTRSSGSLRPPQQASQDFRRQDNIRPQFFHSSQTDPQRGCLILTGSSRLSQYDHPDCQTRLGLLNTRRNPQERRPELSNSIQAPKNHRISGQP
jgi:hypothetical protein